MVAMIDWHSHILPAMDDGSRNPEESCLMLSLLREQGVKTVILTPHFFANEESVSEFLERRKQSYALLCKQEIPDGMRLLCGAEVKYYPGISRMAELDCLTIEDTNLLLLEMPMSKWTDFTVRELRELASMRGLKVILAHIDRYLDLQNKSIVEMLAESGLLMQMNASAFDRFGSRRSAMKLLNAGLVQFIGSDCHHMEMRPPRIASAYETIGRKLGEQYLSQMTEYGYRVLDRKKKSSARIEHM